VSPNTTLDKREINKKIELKSCQRDTTLIKNKNILVITPTFKLDLFPTIKTYQE